MAAKAVKAKAKTRLKVADRPPKMQSLLRARLAKASSLEEALIYVMDALERVRVARAAGWERTRDAHELELLRLDVIVALGIEHACATFAGVLAVIADDVQGEYATRAEDYEWRQAQVRRHVLSMLGDRAGAVFGAVAASYRTGRYANLARLVPGA